MIVDGQKYVSFQLFPWTFCSWKNYDFLQNMFDNMSGFWRMQCAEDDFQITPKNYSFYLDPNQREKELKISWVSFPFP